MTMPDRYNFKHFTFSLFSHTRFFKISILCNAIDKIIHAKTNQIVGWNKGDNLIVNISRIFSKNCNNYWQLQPQTYYFNEPF